MNNKNGLDFLNYIAEIKIKNWKTFDFDSFLKKLRKIPKNIRVEAKSFAQEIPSGKIDLKIIKKYEKACEENEEEDVFFLHLLDLLTP